MEDTESKQSSGSKEQLSQKDKRTVFEKLLPYLEEPNLIVTGSIAAKIAEGVNNGECNLNLIDFSTINDIDIMSTSLSQLEQIKIK